MSVRKTHLFWPVLFTVFLTDCGTKRLAVEHLPPYVPHEVLGDVVQFTLAFNKGAAMSVSLGAFSRVGFTLLTFVALLVLGRLYRAAPPHDRTLAVAVALVCGGAIGNLADRLRWTEGVVDFIDVGVGSYRFWIFNVADVGVTLGAIALAVLLGRRETAAQREA